MTEPALVAFETVRPVAYTLIDPLIGLNTQVPLSCRGSYAYVVIDPERFQSAGPQQIDDAFQAAFPKALELAADMGLHYSSIPHYSADLTYMLERYLESAWEELGIKIERLTVDEAGIPADDEQRVMQLINDAENFSAEAGGMGAGIDFGAVLGARRTPTPTRSDEWVCASCGALNTTKFCGECGAPRA